MPTLAAGVRDAAAGAVRGAGNHRYPAGERFFRSAEASRSFGLSLLLDGARGFSRAVFERARGFGRAVFKGARGFSRAGFHRDGGAAWRLRLISAASRMPATARRSSTTGMYRR